MNHADAYVHFKKGEKIAQAFLDKGLSIYDTRVLLELYNRDISTKEIPQVAEVQNPLYVNNILQDLERREYFERIGQNIKITKKGKDLVDETLKNL
jgi:predicted methyltransferase